MRGSLIAYRNTLAANAHQRVCALFCAGFLCRGVRVVVATVGAKLKNEESVKKATVGGVTSEGMLCDAPMLGWVGGGAGAAALLPESYKPAGPSPLVPLLAQLMRQFCQ